jgi:hypothetical protein
LLCKVGRLALATAYPEEYARVLGLAGPGGTRALAEMERRAFGTDADELSAEMMAAWRLGDDFCEAVCSQNAPDRTGLDSRAGRLARILRWAGSVASVLVQPQACAEPLTALVSEGSGLGREALDQCEGRLKSAAPGGLPAVG